MRYLRDLGVDAYLLLYSTDGKGNNSHFIPESDTWDIDKWTPFIVQTDLPNGGISAFKHIFYKKQLKKVFECYDVVIGNGFAPAYLNFIDRELDVFLPYGMGGEFLYYSRSLNLKTLAGNYIHKYFQLAGLKHTKLICTMDVCWDNIKHFSQNKLRVNQIGLPMVYFDNKPTQDFIPDGMQSYADLISTAHFSIFSHVSHIWKNFPPNFPDIKKNQNLIQGFALFIDRNPEINCKLFLIEYGTDIVESKNLIRKLGICENVIWLPKMTRKEIMYLLTYVDIGCSELGGVFWGGVGWEFLCMGVPMIHYIDLSKSKYDNVQLPPFFNVQTPEEISITLKHAYDNRIELREMGEKCKQWFNKFNGISLAKKYKEIIECIHEGKRVPGVNYNFEPTSGQK